MQTGSKPGTSQVYTMMVAMSIDCMATQMQIGLEVSQTRKAHQVDACVHGLPGNSPVFLLARLKQNT